MASNRKGKAAPQTAEDLADAFDRGDDVSEHADMSKAVWKVNVDFPEWMVQALDVEADRLGVPRQALIKMWIDEKLKERGLVKKATA